MVFGFGFDYQGYIEILSDVWSLDLDSLYCRLIISSWTVYPRRGSNAAYNTVADNIVIFGGDNGSSTADTYILHTAPTSVQELRRVQMSNTTCLKLLSNPAQLPCKLMVNIPQPVHTSLTIHDVSGQQIRTLIPGETMSGTFMMTWDGMDDKGRTVPAGTYFITLMQDEVAVTKKAVLVK
jgi:hypothetical protein